VRRNMSNTYRFSHRRDDRDTAIPFLFIPLFYFVVPFLALLHPPLSRLVSAVLRRIPFCHSASFAGLSSLSSCCVLLSRSLYVAL
jgi:hypothetical protein